MKTIINLTHHQPSVEQIAAGVFTSVNNDRVQRLLDFHEMPNAALLKERARSLAELASREFDELGVPTADRKAMVGSAPYFAAPLEAALLDAGIMPLYAYSVRDSVEEVQPDGTTIKINRFKHLGFIAAR